MTNNRWRSRGLLCGILSFGLIVAADAKEPDPKAAERGTPEAMGVPSAAIVEWMDRVDREAPGLMAFRLMRHNRLIAESYRPPFVNHWQYDFGLGKVSRLVTDCALAALVKDGDLPMSELDRLLALDPASPAGSRELSLAVEKASDKTLDQYLRARVLTRLGGNMPFWTATADPQGTMNGGWGLRMMLPDVARVGRILLDQGFWKGNPGDDEQLLSGPATRAIAKARPLGKGFGAASDAGQLLYIRPDADAVLVVFSAAGRGERIRQLADDVLFARMRAGSLPDDAAAQATLKARCAREAVEPMASVSGPRDTASYSLSENSLGWKAIRLERVSTNLQAVIVDGPCGLRRFAAAVGGWERDQLRFSPAQFELFGDLTGDLRLNSNAAWTGPNEFRCRFFACEAPADFRLTLRFDGDRLAAELTSDRERAHRTETLAGRRLARDLDYVRPLSDGERHALFELLPGGDNGGRNSEGDIIRLKDGRLLVVWSRFDTDEDNGPSDICAMTSADGGRTWSPRRIIVPRPGPGENVMSCTLLRLQDGRIALAYLHQPNRPGKHDIIINLVFSRDEGETWSKPKRVVPESMPGHWIVINGGGICQLKSGRLVMPMAPGYSSLMVWYSDDCGETWQHTERITAKDARGYSVMLQEPGVIELKDGRLLMYARCDKGSQYFSHSSDGGATWTVPGPSKMISPRSPARMIRLSNGDILAAWNNHDGHPECRLLFPYHTGYRKPFTLGISRDEGRTWQPLRDFETEGWHCYAALREYDGKVYVVYSGLDLTSLRVSAWTLDELYGPLTGAAALGPKDIPAGGHLVAKIADCDKYAGLNPHFAKAFAFLKRPDLALLPVGRYEIDGKNCWASVQEVKLTPLEGAKIEVHRKYIDIQVPLSGPETYGLFTMTDKQRALPFNEKSDYVLFTEPTRPVTLQPGEFSVFFPPNGAHAPGHGPAGQRHRKLVIKVKSETP